MKYELKNPGKSWWLKKWLLKEKLMKEVKF